MQLTKQGNTYTLVCDQWLPPLPAKLFPFFGDAHNLETLTPPWLKFSILTPRPIEMKVGSLIDYQLSLHGIPIRWRTEITAWDPPHRFVDEQIRGPYRYWRHEHLFVEVSGGCLVTDRVDYRAPFGVLAQPIVGRDVRRIFEYRQSRLTELFHDDERIGRPSHEPVLAC